MSLQILYWFCMEREMERVLSCKNMLQDFCLPRSLAKQGDNALSSIPLCVCLSE